MNAADATLKFQLHNYLIHHDGQFWCMWSQGPPVEDEPCPKPATLQYPHAVEHDGHLLIAFSRNKAQSEVFKVSLKDIEALLARSGG